MLNCPKLLLLGSEEAELGVLKGILDKYAVLRSISNLAELQSVLRDDDYDALVCGWPFNQGTWKDAFLQMQQDSSDLPAIIFSGAGDEEEWVNVIKSGAFDLLVSPYRVRTALAIQEHAVNSNQAWQSHRAAPQPMESGRAV